MGRERRGYRKERYWKNRIFIDSLKAVPCVDCGNQYPACVMDFDHRDGESKVKNVSQLAMWSQTAIRAEAEKCVVVCANCHRLRTWKRKEGQPPYWTRRQDVNS